MCLRTTWKQLNTNVLLSIFQTLEIHSTQRRESIDLAKFDISQRTGEGTIYLYTCTGVKTREGSQLILLAVSQSSKTKRRLPIDL